MNLGDLFGNNAIEKRTQLLFKDNGNVILRQLEVTEASLVEKVNGSVQRGWQHIHRLQYHFEGYKNIPSDEVTLSHERDIIYDPHGILSAEEKPELGTGFNRRGIREVAESKCFNLEHQKPSGTMMDKVTIFLGVGFSVEVLVWAIIMIK